MCVFANEFVISLTGVELLANTSFAINPTKNGTKSFLLAQKTGRMVEIVFFILLKGVP